MKVSEEIPNVMLEVDVAATRDSVLILMHDKTLNRTTNGEGEVRLTYFDSLRNLRLVDNVGVQTDFAIPVLDSVLSWLSTSEAFLSIDVKDDWIWDSIIRKVEQHGVRSRIEIITYNHQDARAIHDRYPEVYLSVSISSKEALDDFLQLGISGEKVAAFTGLELKKPEFYRLVRDAGFVVTLGTLFRLDKTAFEEGDQLYGEWRALGIDRFATDRPREVYRELAR